MSELIKEKKDFYVYILYREDGETPFYVGKGRRDRWLSHERDVEFGRSHKDNIIWRMKSNGIVVPKRKAATDLTDDQARRLEIRLISIIGRKPRGPLTNLTDGGDGVRGYQITEKRRAELRANWKPHPPEIERMRIERCIAAANDPERRAKISAALKGRKKSAEQIEKSRLARTGKKRGPLTDEHRKRIADAHRGKPKTEEHRAKLTGQVRSPETIERIRIAQRNKVRSEEERLAHIERMHKLKGRPKPDGFGEKIRAALTGRKRSPESIEKVRIANTGRILSDETKAKMSEAHKGKSKSPEHAAKLAANLQRYWAERRAKEAARDHHTNHRCAGD